MRYTIMTNTGIGRPTPAILGTLNQTGKSDREASTFATREEAQRSIDDRNLFDADADVWIEEVAEEQVDCLGACPECGETSWTFVEDVTTTRHVRIVEDEVHCFGEMVDAESGSNGRFVCACGCTLEPTAEFVQSIVWE